MDSSRFLGVALVLAGCVREVPADFATATALPDDERHPDGIAVDLRSDPPAARDHVYANSDVASLRAPLGIGAAHDRLAELFAAIVSEDNTKLSALMVGSVVVHDLRKVGAPPRNALNTWLQRFRKYNYHRLQDTAVYRQSDVSVYRRAQFDRLPLEVAGTSAAEADLVFHVRILTPEVRNERLWGNELFIWFQRREDRYVIAGLAEELPF